jgi:hypothetical protein
MNTLLIIAGILIFLAGRVYESAKANGLFTIPTIPNGDDRAMEDREELEELRDKLEVSCSLRREDMGFGGEWK